MAEKKTGGHGPGVDTKQASDLEDARFGTYDPVAQKKSDTSRVTPSEVAQPGASMQGEPVPATPVDEFHLPEGLKRQPIGPYSRDKGRGNDKVPDHVPGRRAPIRGR